MSVCYACNHASVIEIYDRTIIPDIPVLQKQVRKIRASLLIRLVRMEVLLEFVLKYFMWLPGLCTRLLEADDGMQAHLCVHIFMDSSGAIVVSFALQIDCHTAIAVNTVVPVVDLFNFLLHFCFLDIIFCLPVFPVVVVSIWADPQLFQQPADAEFFMVLIDESVSL